VSQPVELRLRDAGRTLEIDWAEAGSSRLSAFQLRGACRCAACTRARRDGTPGAVDPAIAVARIEPIGGYAVNLQFSDGHARGIFPWAYLREIAAADAITCSTPSERTGRVPSDAP
jgi:DUF971 family protein